jgi:hypothetical protein
MCRRKASKIKLERKTKEIRKVESGRNEEGVWGREMVVV